MTTSKKIVTEDACIETARPSNFNKPSWLLTAIADVEENMKILAALNMPEEDDDEGDTFAERAESYYRKRPQLLALLHDLYNAYLSLSHRYSQSLSKHNNNLNLDEEQGQEDHDGDASDTDDAKSSLSYQLQTPQILENGGGSGTDHASAIIAELVIKQVECDILANEMSVTEKKWGETARKIELQKSLLEVLESERLILLNENARLGYRVGALVEENKGLATESVFVKRKAGELAGCVMKMRDDQRVCLMSRKIEDLQGQVSGLEKMNKEYYQQLINVKKIECFQAAGDGMKNGEDEEKQNLVNKMMREKHQQRRLLKQGEAAVNKTVGGGGGGGGCGGGGRVSRWWDRVKNIDLFLCGAHYSSTCDV